MKMQRSKSLRIKKENSRKQKVRDPVCGMERFKNEFKFTSKYKGKAYYFCSEQCKEMFEGEPRGYVGE